MTLIAYDEEQALKAVLNHHDVKDDPDLTEDLCHLIEWAHEDEAHRLGGGSPPPFLVTLLGQMGLYTRATEQVLR